jgi:hypothetical protein
MKGTLLESAMLHISNKDSKLQHDPGGLSGGSAYEICGHRMHESIIFFELAISAESTGLPACIAAFISTSDVNASQSQYSQ